ncbi:CBS domain containing protein [Anaeromyxobacter sp. K]|uniref:hemolysin family protein n=1 Tax=Anaeromyxobacter sp. (strain K) TaxID=447217 RepID=UPI00015F93A0|nr:hemolysin family protein [Anaeromyxobacter sp. K]ACG75111.1 CBS domain containing protein [Anaeromyxobacter sp. K]
MEGASAAQILWLVAGIAALLALRAVAAALEAALVAVGVPRAQALAQPPDASARARALGALAGDAEATAFTLRAAATLGTLLAGVLAGAGGPALVPGLPPWPARLVAALVAGLLSLPISAAARGLGAAHGEGVALALALPFRGLSELLRPLARAVAWAAGRRARFSLPPPPLDEMERALAEYAGRGGSGSEGTRELIHNVFEFREKVARDVMVPRTDVVAVELGTPVPQIIRTLSEEGHSRMPVYRESLDQIAGVLHARDLVPLLAHPELIVLADILRPAHFVPWSKPVEQLLREMQRRHLHMAFVVDEFGGVMGICTIEDVLEQIVGDIQDEFEEEDEGREVEQHADGSFTVQGAAAVAEFNRAAQAGVPEDQGFETMAGFVSSLAGAIPARGDRFFWKGWVFTVAEADPRRVVKVRAARVKRGA